MNFSDRTELQNKIPNLDEKLKELEEANENDEDEEEIPEHILRRHRYAGNFSCLACQPPNCENQRIFHGCVKCFTTHVRDTDGTTKKSKGCTRNRQQTLLFCSTLKHDGAAIHAKNNKSSQYSFDCCAGNLCNQNTTFPKLPSVPAPIKPEVEEPEKPFHGSLLMYIGIIIGSMAIFIGIIVFVLWCQHKKRTEDMAKNPQFDALLDVEMNGLRATKVGDSTLREYQKDIIDDGASCMTSGSGSGMRRLDPRSFARDIELKVRFQYFG